MSLLLRSATSRYYIKPLNGTLGLGGAHSTALTRLKTLAGGLGFAGSAVGGGVGFNADADHLEYNTLTNLSTYSVMGWFKITTDRNAFSSAFYLESGASWTQLATDSDGTTLKYFDQGANSVVLGALTVGKWYFIGFSNNAGSWKAYLGDETNPLVVSSGTGAPSSAANPILYIASSTSAEFLDGSMGECLAYNAVLSDAEFEAQRLKTTPQRTANLIGQWRMLDAASKLVDSSGNGNPLTAPGAGSWTSDTGPTLQSSIGGELLKTTIKALAGTLSFVGALIATFIHGGTTYNATLTATLDFAGAAAKNTTKLLSASLASSGGLVKVTTKILAGVLASAGALAKTTTHLLSGVLSFSGALVRTTIKALSGALASSAVLVRVTQKALAGTLTSAGALVRTTQRALAATLSSSGALVKTTIRALSGVLSFSGALSTLKLFFLALTGVLSSSGAIVRSTTKALAGTQGFTGALVKMTQRAFSGSLSFSGAIVRTTIKALSGVLTSSGNLVRSIVHVLSGSLSFVGTALKTTSKFFTGTLTSAGSLAKTATKALAGSLSSSGVIVRSVTKALSATLNTAGALSKQTRRALTGVLSFIGTLSASILTGGAFFLAITASLGLSGSSLKTTTKSVAGSLTASGGMFKTTQKALLAVLGFVGSIVRSISKPLSGVLSSSGGFVKTTQRALVAVLSFSGGFFKLPIKLLTGSISFTGDIAKTTAKRLSGALSLSASTLVSWYAIARAGVLARLSTLRGTRAVVSLLGPYASMSVVPKTDDTPFASIGVTSRQYASVETVQRLETQIEVSRVRAVLREGQLLSVKENNDEEISFKVLQRDGTPQGVSGWTFEFKVVDANNVTLLTKTIGSGITITDANNGLGKVTIDAADTNGKAGDEYLYELKAVDNASKNITLSGPTKFVVSETII